MPDETIERRTMLPSWYDDQDVLCLRRQVFEYLPKDLVGAFTPGTLQPASEYLRSMLIVLDDAKVQIDVLLKRMGGG